MERVVNLRKTSGYNTYIGRANGELKQSIWANPFTVKEYGRGNCIDKYEEYLRKSPELLHKLPSLKDKTLGCWCKPEPCHGDILSRYAHKEEGKFRLLVSGSRSLYAFDVIKDFIIETLMPKYKDIIIIEGGAKGIDIAARNVAKDLDIDNLTIPAIWEVNGVKNKRAGFERNSVMLDLADGVLCVWDGVSSGTRDMMKKAREANLPLKVITIKGNTINE